MVPAPKAIATARRPRAGRPAIARRQSPITSAALAPVSSRSNGVPLCGATTSSQAHEPPAGVVPCIPAPMALTKASAVETSPYRPASGTSRRSTQGCWVKARETRKASVATASPPTTRPVCTERERRSQRPMVMPSNRYASQVRHG
jgi:hypothetical protein